MEKGFINFYDHVRGYGFIRRESGRDVCFPVTIPMKRFLPSFPAPISGSLNELPHDRQF